MEVKAFATVDITALQASLYAHTGATQKAIENVLGTANPHGGSSPTGNNRQRTIPCIPRFLYCHSPLGMRAEWTAREAAHFHLSLGR